MIVIYRKEASTKKCNYYVLLDIIKGFLRSEVIKQDTISLPFDAKKNMQFPQMSTCDTFYWGQFWCFTFDIHSAKSVKDQIYSWPEMHDMNGVNEVLIMTGSVSQTVIRLVENKVARIYHLDQSL